MSGWSKFCPCSMIFANAHLTVILEAMPHYAQLTIYSHRSDTLPQPDTPPASHLPSSMLFILHLSHLQGSVTHLETMCFHPQPMGALAPTPPFRPRAPVLSSPHQSSQHRFSQRPSITSPSTFPISIVIPSGCGCASRYEIRITDHVPTSCHLCQCRQHYTVHTHSRLVLFFPLGQNYTYPLSTSL